jgi:hypothetical protein
MNATDLSSLARFTDADLRDILARRQLLARQMRRQYGRDHFHARAALASVRTVVDVLAGRGVEVTA